MLDCRKHFLKSRQIMGKGRRSLFKGLLGERESIMLGVAEAHPGKNDQLKLWGEDAAMSLTLKQRQGWRRMHCCRAGGFDISEGLVMDQSSLDLDCWHGTGSSCSWVDLLSGSKSTQSQSSTISTCEPLLANSSVRWMSHDRLSWGQFGSPKPCLGHFTADQTYTSWQNLEILPKIPGVFQQFLEFF